MTNLEKILQEDGDKLIEFLSRNICIDTATHKIKNIATCLNCRFVINHGKRLKCNVLAIEEWLRSNVDDKKEVKSD